MIQPRLVLCSGADPPAADAARGRKVVWLDTLGPNSNTNLRIENVTDAFSKGLSPRLIDLLEIAAYVYAADCEASRNRAWDEEKSREPWDRDFRFVVPVRDLAFWRQEEVRERLISALSFLSTDTFQFVFQRLAKTRASAQYLGIEHYDTKPFEGVDRVVMFSGGLDSLAGALTTMAEGRSLVAVSHRSSPQISRRQRELFRRLRERAQVPLTHIPVWVNKTLPSRESTQRSRSFLFSALGTAVASVLGAGGVRLYENGVTSLNWPVTAEVLRSRASRTTHPEALKRLEDFYRLVTEHDAFAVDNPFIFMTKTDVVAAIGAQGAADLLLQTSSCSHTMFQSRVPAHCGCCTQCMDRRVAVLAAGMEGCDSAADYERDVFCGARREGYDRSIAVGYVRTARELAAMDEAEVVTAYSDELSQAARCFRNVGETAQRFIEMYQRHAAAVCRVVEAQLEAHAADQLHGQLDRTSLLGMIGLRRHLEEAEGAPPEVAVPAEQMPANVFRRDGEKWTVSFGGTTKFYNGTKGMQYIAFLIGHPGEEFHVLQLAADVDGAPPPDPLYSQMTAEQLEAAGMPVASHTSDRRIVDGKYQSDVRQKVRELQEKRDMAEAMGDEKAAAVAQDEIESYLGVLASGVGRGGRRREFTDEGGRARQRVSKAVHTALRAIRKHQPGLHAHLQAAMLPLGYMVRYRPDGRVDWRL